MPILCVATAIRRSASDERSAPRAAARMVEADGEPPTIEMRIGSSASRRTLPGTAFRRPICQYTKVANGAPVPMTWVRKNQLFLFKARRPVNHQVPVCHNRKLKVILARNTPGLGGERSRPKTRCGLEHLISTGLNLRLTPLFQIEQAPIRLRHEPAFRSGLSSPAVRRHVGWN